MSLLQEYDLLWIQATPAIATMYYKKYLVDTHTLFCPDDTNESQLPRKIAKRLLHVMTKNKKIAIHFLTPCTETKRDTLYKFILKSQPDLSSYCLAIPTTHYQTHLLLGWSTGITDPEWKRKCAITFDPEAYIEFIPPTRKQGAFTSDIYLKQACVVSKKIFSKKTLVVDMTLDMISFDLQQGICFNRGVENSIRGWMGASDVSTRTLVWIIHEKSLYGETINSMIQEKRSVMLEKYREKLFSFIEAFATTIPIYCYLIDCCTTLQLSLTDYIAQIQHRHHICLSKTILLKRHKDEQVDTLEMKPIYLDSIPIHSVSKWESIYLKLFSEMSDNAYDDLNYISPELLNLESSAENYITPMLSQQDNIDSLTVMETIGTDQSLHTVSAKSPQVFKNWIDIITEASLSDKDYTDTTTVPIITSYSSVPTITQPSVPILHHLTTEKIKTHINNTTTYERGLSIMYTLSDIQYSLDMDHVILSAFAKNEQGDHPFVLSLRIDGQGDIDDASCGCSTGTLGRCQHIVAALERFLQDHPPKDPLSRTDSSSSSSSSRKRSLNQNQQEDDKESDGNDTDNTKKYKSITKTTTEHTVEITSPSLNPIVIDFSSGSSHNSYPLGSIPTITSSHYDSASSRSFSSHSLPPINSSGSLEESHSNSSGKESVTQHASVIEETRSFGYTADDEEQFSVNESSRAEENEATQYYNPTKSREETQTQTYKTAESSKTQAYRPEDAETQIYNPLETTEEPAILLDDSDAGTQKDHSYQTILLDDSDEEEEASSLPLHTRNNSRLTQGTSFHTAETSLLDNVLSSADSFSNLNHSD